MLNPLPHQDYQQLTLKRGSITLEGCSCGFCVYRNI